MTPSAQRTRILLVVADPDDFAMLSGMLETVDHFEVRWAESAASAVEVIAKDSCDVALVDEGLAAVSGSELIRPADQSLATPIIVLTTRDGGEIKDLAGRVEGVDRLFKTDVTPAILEFAVGSAVAHRATLLELENARAELERLQTASKQFLSSMSHDLRTPLSAIVGLAELLRDPDHTLDPASRSDMISTIVDSGFEVANMVEDLVTVARHETGQLKVVAVPVSLAAQVNQALEAMAPSIDIEVRGEAPRAQADPGRVRQILRSLLTNAARHGGEQVIVELGEDRGMATAMVIDNGHGIAHGQEEMIFGWLDSGTRSQVSSGIGLPISRELARHMGGDLRYMRTAGTTRFELTLPVDTTG